MRGWKGFKCAIVLTFLVVVTLTFVGCLSPATSNPSLENRPPATPSVRTPSNGGEDVSVTPTLSWTCSDPDGDSLTYEVFFGTDRERLEKLGSTSSTSYRITEPLKVDTTYYWKVVARDSRGATKESDIWSFKTARLRILASGDEPLSHSDEALLSPAIGPDGCIYVCSGESIMKFSQELEPLEPIQPSFPPSTPLTIDPQTGKVYFAAFGELGGHVVVYEGDSNFEEVFIERSVLVSPIVFGEHVYVVDVSGKVYKMKKEDLTIEDSLELQMNFVSTNPVMVDGKLIVVGEKQGEHKVFCVDTSKMELAWESKIPEEAFPKYIAVSKNKKVYFAGYGKLLCLDSGTGNKEWEFSLEGSDGSFLVAPVVSKDGWVYLGVGKEDGSGIIYAVDPKGNEKWRKDLKELVEEVYFMSFVIGDTNVLYVAVENILLALNAKKGDLIDEMELGSYVYSNPVLYNGKIFLVCENENGDYNLYAIRALNDGLDDPSQAWPMFQKDQYHTGVR